jgi:hypothetical protein
MFAFSPLIASLPKHNLTHRLIRLLNQKQATRVIKMPHYLHQTYIKAQGDRLISNPPQQTQAAEVIEGEAEEGDRLDRDAAIKVGIKAAVG